MTCSAAHTLRFGLAVLAAVACLQGCAAGNGPTAQGACTVERRAELPITVLRNFLLVPAALDGDKVLLVVDTGAEATTLTPETVASLQLPWVPSRTLLLGVGGAVHGRSARLKEMQLGELEERALALDVSDLPPFRGTERPVAGLLGADLLGNYDIELDMTQQKMVLYAVPNCPRFVPAGYPADGQELYRAGGGLIYVSARVDGRTVRALIDTGARSSLVTRRVALGLGVTDQELARDPQVPGLGIGGGAVEFRRHRFAEVRVGGVTMRNMTMNVAALPIAGIDMLLGADWLAGRQVWISRAAGRLFQL